VTAPGLIAAGVLAGALCGLAAGWLSVVLERVERLRQEEDEERREYEQDVARTREAALAAGETPADAPPWQGEHYGWTWLERVLAPLLGALGFGLFVAHGPVDVGLLIHCFWIALFVHIVVFDLKHRLILNRISYPAVLLAIAVAQVSPGLTVATALIGGIAVLVFFWLQNLLSRGSIGLGDAKLGALVGAVTGAGPDLHHIGAAYAVIYAIFLGAGVALLLLILRLRRLKDPIPYGPFLCAGAAIILYLGP
jgi:leader peptidase (prepilin peptidase) / N-methyltransferase